MPSILGQYSFLPWLRQGLAGDIQEVDHLGTIQGGTGQKERAIVAASIKLNDEHTVGKSFAIHGPGDIAGVNPLAIVKAEPQAGVRNFEANFLPYIEFYEEDFPWRYTPAKADSNNRIRPWMTLIVCEASEFEFNDNAGAGLPFVVIKAAAFADVMPDHRELWAFAHVHVQDAIDDAANFEVELETKLAANPDIAVSRLLSARKLKANTAYQVFLIPSFETGRLAGLGEDPKDVVAQQSAWDVANPAAHTVRPLTFPVYHNWAFATSDTGDFEALVSKLKTMPAGPNLGMRPMNIEQMGYGIQAGTSKTIGLEGALRPPSFNRTPWPNLSSVSDQTAQQDLKKVLNLSEGYKTNAAATNPFYSIPVSDDPIITPPIYGKFHMATVDLDSLNNPDWIKTLNLDPRYRAVAGLGAKVVQEKQEDLMEKAWQQVGAVNDANQKIREAQLAKQVNKNLFTKHVDNGDKDRMIMLTSQMQKRLVSGGKTIHAAIKESKVPLAAKSASFKRIIRPGKTSNKKLNKMSTNRLHENVIHNFDKSISAQGAITAAPRKLAPQPTIQAADLNNVISLTINQLNAPEKQTIFNLPTIVKNTTLNGQVANDRAALIAAINASAEPADVKGFMQEIINDLSVVTLNPSSLLENKILVIGQTVYEKYYNNITTGRVSEGVVIKRALTNDEISKGKNENIVPGPSLQDQEQFRDDFVGFSNFTSGITQVASAAPLLADSLSGQIKANLNLEQATALRVQHKIKRWSESQAAFVPLQALKPIMAHPKFDEAVYQNLSALSQDYIIPNVSEVQANSITLLETNDEFIEAYMTGLNHEMARELLWREYPTDQRGSYFRQFWDIKDNKSGDPASTYTVKPLHEWSGQLGDHPNSTASYLVLLVRGELLEKFPNTLIYAQKAEYGKNGGVVDKNKARQLKASPSPADFRFPVLRGKLDPDITFFGFDFTDENVRGDRIKDPGWFFVFKERPGEIRFGLDDFMTAGATAPSIPSTQATSWNDMAWGHLLPTGGNLANIKHLNVGGAPRVNVPGNVTWGSNSADMAHILFQNPVILARHASEMT